MKAAKCLSFLSLKSQQKKVIVSFLEGNDVFVSLPIGSGKSLCLALNFVFHFRRVLWKKQQHRHCSVTIDFSNERSGIFCSISALGHSIESLTLKHPVDDQSNCQGGVDCVC